MKPTVSMAWIPEKDSPIETGVHFKKKVRLELRIREEWTNLRRWSGRHSKEESRTERLQCSLYFVVVVFLISHFIIVFSRGDERTLVQGKGIGWTNHGWTEESNIRQFLDDQALSWWGKMQDIKWGLEPCQTITHHLFWCSWTPVSYIV